MACETQDMITPFERYTIKEGDHYSDHGIHELSHRKISFQVIFDDTCKNVIDDQDQADINKLFGFSECNQTHHDNSARFGWRWSQSALKIYGYVYNNGARHDTFLAKIKLNTSHTYTLEMDDDNYYFTIEGYVDRIPMKRTNTCTKGIYYLLYPYFGGNTPAPHDINIYMKRLY